MNFKEMVQRIAGPRSSNMVQYLDIRCDRGHRFSNNTAVKVQTQGTTVKDPCPEKAKTKDPKPILFCINAVEPSKQEKKDQKDKKKKFRQRRQQKNTPATSDNAIDVLKKRRRQALVKSRVLSVIRKATTPVATPSL